MSSVEPVVRVRGVGKLFRPPASLRSLLTGHLRGPPFRALADVTLDVGGGEALGLMGANGAGKSTLLRIVAGLLLPSEGEVTVGGIDTSTGGAALAGTIGYVAADERGLVPSLAPRELLAWYSALCGLPRARALARADELVAQLGLDSWANRPIRELSTGIRRRTALARALVGAPRLLLLDEPTRGLDPAAVTTFHRELAAFLASGGTIVIATHDRAEAGALCGRVAVLASGRLMALDVPDQAARRLIETEHG